MTKYIVLMVLIVSFGFSSVKDPLITKKIYPNISKDSIFNAAKMVFSLSNNENKNNDFVINSYRDKLIVEKVIFHNRVIRVDLLLETWLLEVHEFENESRVNLLIDRKNAVDLSDKEDVKIVSHNLFWDRLDYILGIGDSLDSCESHFPSTLGITYCANFLLKENQNDSKFSNNILISEKNMDINTIDSIKADIYDETDLTLKKNKNDIFKRNEDILNGNIVGPIMENSIMEKKAKKVIIKKKKNLKAELPVEINADIDSDDVINNEEEIDKFQDNLKDIVNMKNTFNNKDVENVIKESNELKENSEFSLESK